MRIVRGSWGTGSCWIEGTWIGRCMISMMTSILKECWNVVILISYRLQPGDFKVHGDRAGHATYPVRNPLSTYKVAGYQSFGRKETVKSENLGSIDRPKLSSVRFRYAF